MSSIILLIAMIGAIVLTMQKGIGIKRQQVFLQNTRDFAKTIKKTLKANKEDVKVIDLYSENKTFEFEANKIQEYKALIMWSDRIYIVSPVWWFRTTPALESFFDQVLTPGFAYNFIPLTKLYGYPKPLLSHKKVRTYLTHGAPALPVV